MERVSTGIEELDSKLSGGYPKKKVILITGVAGSGKTIFGIHYLYRACQEGKKCVLIATEETPEDILQQARMLEHDLEPYYEKGQLIIERVFESRTERIEETRYGFKPEGLDLELPYLAELVPEGTECVVIDNIGVFTIRISVRKLRDEFDGLSHILMKKGCTVLYIMDEAAYNMTNQLAEYSAYGSIRLLVKENSYLGKMERYIYIPKMRSTPVSPYTSVFEISSKGIKIKASGDSEIIG
ncbi:MAG: ATPase domain-containing protein [Methanosarcinaceae archaeon]|nr:ATPase domain-containing protein [Methanosarcinaceae archaeon]MDD4748977.1 ATPase domain-containing protein [Methanosarcinaceae archaeon]